MVMSSAAVREWKRRLTHVRWIGGPPDAGKSTVTRLLASMYNVHIYHQDEHEMEHIGRADAARFPRHAALRQRLTQGEDEFFESWVSDSPPTMAHSTQHNWIERIPMIVEDVLGLADDGMCIVDGPGFFPDAIRPLLNDPHQAAWLIPTERFKRESHARRGKSAWRHGTSNPELALRHHIERDLIFMGIYRNELRDGDFVIEVDGSVPPESIAERVAAWFGLAGQEN